MVLPYTDPRVTERCDAVDLCLAQLKDLAAGKIPDELARDPEAYIQSLVARFPDAADFQAGGWAQYAAVWRHLFRPYLRSRIAVKPMLAAIEKGISWPLVPPKTQRRMPDFQRKLRRLAKALHKSMQPGEVEHYLSSAEPKQLHMLNHPSVDIHPDFVTEAVAALLQAKAAHELPPGQRPLVCNAIGVVDSKPKLRLILDPLYPNMLLRYEMLRYEQLADLTTYITRDDWATTTDEKSGYYHQPIAPELWTLLGFSYAGRYYVFTHMPFGVGPACRAYTTVKQELYRVVRDLGAVRMTFLIDDQLNAANSKLRAYFQCAILLRLQWALGFTLSIPKCQLTPTRKPRFLGMITDIQNLSFYLPDEKIERFQELVRSLQGSAHTTARTLAQLAGTLFSFAPAVQLAPLYAQALYKVMKGLDKWDVLFPTDTVTAALEALHWVSYLLPAWNGKTWHCTRGVLLMAGDYSSTHGYAAYAPHGELNGQPIVVTLTPAELERIAANSFSSTLGELTAVLKTLEVLAEHHPHLIKGKVLHYEGDNQAAMTILPCMAGNAVNFQVVRAIWERAADLDVGLSFEWKPRTDLHQVHADAWSKVVDKSQWALNDELFRSSIADHALVLSRGGITIDHFADHTNHKHPRFRSRHWCPGTLGVNSFRYFWAADPITGARELGYANGDFSQMGAILAKLIDERADCVVVYPDWPRYWQVLWHQLPVRTDFGLEKRADMCVPGPRVPLRAGAAPQPPKYSIRVAIILWGL